VNHDELLAEIKSLNDSCSSRLGNALKAVVELHEPETDYLGKLVCGYCKSLCHSETGLRCDWDGDGLYPCWTIKIIEEELLALRLDFIEFNARVADVAPEKIVQKPKPTRWEI